MFTINASNLPRFMACNGSRLMQPDPANPLIDDTVRQEGNAVHWLALTVFNGEFQSEELVDRKAPNGIYITPEMAEHVDEYLEYICTVPYIAERSAMEVETTFDGENFQVRGRSDCIRELDNVLYIHDFKYGYSTVEPDRNWTLIAHAVGYCISQQISPELVTFVIHQPRAPHREGRVRAWTIGYGELIELYGELSSTLSNPSDELRTGSHCYRCPAAASCPARQTVESSAIDVAHMAFTSELSNDDLAARMDLIRRAATVLEQAKKAYEDLTIARLQSGEVIANYAMEAELANTSWKPVMTPELILALSAVNISMPKMATPNQAKKLGLSEEFVNSCTERRTKGVRLVRVDANKRAKKLLNR